MGAQEEYASEDFGETTHTSERGAEPVFGERGKVSHAEKVETGSMQAQKVTHRLRDLMKDYYLFSVAPIYFVTGFDKNIVELFATDLNMSLQSIAFVSESPLFVGLGDWSNVVEGIPWEAVRSTVDSENNLFETFVMGMVMPRHGNPTRKIASQYWRANIEHIRVQEAGAMASTKIDIYVPTGDVCRIYTKRRPDGLIEFVKDAPEEWVKEQSEKYYLTGGV
jgi:hypothetical protein